MPNFKCVAEVTEELRDGKIWWLVSPVWSSDDVRITRPNTGGCLLSKSVAFRYAKFINDGGLLPGAKLMTDVGGGTYVNSGVFLISKREGTSHGCHSARVYHLQRRPSS
jgi:hypothetical protein